MRLREWLYDLGMAPLVVVGAVVALFSSRGRRRWQERLGWWRVPPGEYLWLHGASVGEVGGVIPLIAPLRERYPHLKILLTSTSPTGLDRGASEADATALLPFDQVVLYRLALRNIRIAGFIFGETEVWPALLRVLQRSGIPCSLVNGRLSERSSRGYRWARPLLFRCLVRLHLVLASDERSLSRYRALGVRPQGSLVGGNAKYDHPPRIRSEEERGALRSRLFGKSEDLPTVVLGSIWPGEEGEWLRAFEKVTREGMKVRLVIAPRHLEKVGYFASVLAQGRYRYRRWSEGEQADPADLVLLDVMGELDKVYSIAHGAFIGGSLVPVGGHNPLEAAAYGCAIAIGAYHHSVSFLVEELQRRGGITLVSEARSIERFVVGVAQGRSEISAAGTEARKVWREMQGATERIVNSTLVLSRGKSLHTMGARWWLVPLSAAYGTVMALRNALFDRGLFSSYASSVPVISVGNVGIGGNGKTPFCRWLVTALEKNGARPVILSRGYGGYAQGPLVVTEGSSPAEVGDEPLLLARKTGVPVVVARSRVDGAKFIERESLGDVIILDDGLQHRWLNRGSEIICIDVTDDTAVRSFLAGDVLPAGRLREEVEGALLRSHVVVLVRRTLAPAGDDSRRLFEPILPPTIRVVRAGIVGAEVRSLHSDSVLSPCAVVALSAIASPQGFWSTLESLGFTIKERVALRDHALLDHEITRLSARFPSLPIVCTEKDGVKVAPPLRPRVAEVRIDFGVEEGDLLAEELFVRAFRRVPRSVTQNQSMELSSSLR